MPDNVSTRQLRLALPTFCRFRCNYGRLAKATLVGLLTILSGICVSTRARADGIASSMPLAFDAFDRRRDAPINEEPNYRSDGVYGRFDGEISLVPSVGMQWAGAGWFTQFGISSFYLNTIGVAFRSADGHWSPITRRADFNVSTLALAIRPLFLLRWSQDWEKGPSFLDLTLDSLTLSVGSYWSQQHSVDKQHMGLETELSFGIPLLAKAHGPWLTPSVVNRLPKVTSAQHSVDMTYGLRLEWAFSLGG
jgi:hypothetical protein